MSDGVARVLARIRLSVPDRPVRLLDALGSAINSCAWNRQQAAAARLDESLEELEHSLPAPTVGSLDGLLDREEEILRAERLGRWMRSLRERLASDAEALRLVDLFEQGISKRADQAEATGWDAERVRNARRRIFHAAEAIKHAELTVAEARAQEDDS